MSAPEPRQRPVVVGQGYVGLPLAMRAVEVGFDVIDYDLVVQHAGYVFDTRHRLSGECVEHL